MVFLRKNLIHCHFRFLVSSQQKLVFSSWGGGELLAGCKGVGDIMNPDDVYTRLFIWKNKPNLLCKSYLNGFWGISWTTRIQYLTGLYSNIRNCIGCFI